MAFPFGLERGDVDDDAAARIGRFAEADDQRVARDAEIFHRAREDKRVRRDDADIRLAIDETLRREILRVHDRGIDIGEDFELVRHPGVVAVGRQAVGDDAIAREVLDERFDHLVLLRARANPVVGLNGHTGS